MVLYDRYRTLVQSGTKMSQTNNDGSRPAADQRVQLRADAVVAAYIHAISDRHRPVEPADDKGASLKPE